MKGRLQFHSILQSVVMRYYSTIQYLW